MNAQRRKLIDDAIKLLEEIKPKLDDAKSMIETAKDEERDYADNMPDNMKQGDRGERAETAASNLEEAFEAIDGLDIDDLIGKLNEAQE